MIRNLFRITAVTFVLTTAGVALFAQSAKFDWKEASEGGYTYKYVTNDPTHSRFYKLKNGLTVILSPTKKEPRIQTYIATKAGSKTDPGSVAPDTSRGPSPSRTGSCRANGGPPPPPRPASAGARAAFC